MHRIHRIVIRVPVPENFEQFVELVVLLCVRRGELGLCGRLQFMQVEGGDGDVAEVEGGLRGRGINRGQTSFSHFSVDPFFLVWSPFPYIIRE